LFLHERFPFFNARLARLFYVPDEVLATLAHPSGHHLITRDAEGQWP
jgi:hypothetical protein